MDSESSRLCACGCGQETPPYKRTRVALGRVAGEPARFREGHNGRTGRSVLERIRDRVDVDPVTGCWLYRGPDRKGGYRTIKVGSRRDGTRRTVYVHVAAWEAVNGPRPEGMTLDHVVCDRPSCCNPSHLRPATIRDNTLRSPIAVTAVNARKTVCPKCGGPLAPKRSGRPGRECRACLLAYYRTYRATRRRRPACRWWAS